MKRKMSEKEERIQRALGTLPIFDIQASYKPRIDGSITGRYPCSQLSRFQCRAISITDAAERAIGYLLHELDTPASLINGIHVYHPNGSHLWYEMPRDLKRWELKPVVCTF